MAQRRQKITDPDQKALMAKAAMQTILPPSHCNLDSEEMVFWHNIISTSGRSQWTDHDLEMVAVLSQQMAEVQAQQKILKTEDMLTPKAQGGYEVNPRKKAIAMTLASIMSLRRSLAMQTTAGKDKRDVDRRREISREYEAGVREAVADDFIGKPSVIN